MKVLLTAHIDHYTIGLTRSLSKYLLVTVTGAKPELIRYLRNSLCIDNNTTFISSSINGILTSAIKFASIKFLAPLHDVIHANTSQSGLYCGFTDKLVVTEHGCPSPTAHRREASALIKLNNLGIPIIAISRYTESLLRRFYGIKVYKVIYHGVIEEFFHRPRLFPIGRPVRILYVSRLDEGKEPLVFINSLNKIQNTINFTAYIRGDGPLINYVRSLIMKYNLASKVKFLPRLPFETLIKLYQYADIFIHTNSTEPFGLAVLEAMAASLPVIVPDRGGASEIAGDAAVKFTPKDHVDLAERMISVLTDAKLYEKLSYSSYRRAKIFNWDKVAYQYIDVYKRISR